MQTYEQWQTVEVNREGKWRKGAYLWFHDTDDKWPHYCVAPTNADPSMDGWEPDWYSDNDVRPINVPTSSAVKGESCDDKVLAWEIGRRHMDKPSVLSAAMTLINTLSKAYRCTK